MGWDDGRARDEFQWLNLMARLKYDEYRGFMVGVRFLESLTYWLQQFDQKDREHAYELVRKNLIYISRAEIQHLIDLTYPNFIRKRLFREIAERRSMPFYKVVVDEGARKDFMELQRKTLFLGLSDGARIDMLRRSTSGLISNEQIVAGHQVDKRKWDSLLGDLRTKLDDAEAKFAFVFLIDDFTGSGATLLRKEKSDWKGKIYKFWDNIKSMALTQTHFESDWKLCIYHYVATEAAYSNLEDRQKLFLADQKNKSFKKAEFLAGMILPKKLHITKTASGSPLLDIIDKYYDSGIENEHTSVGGGNSIKFGFSNGGLPLVMEHNTPNNSIALLWAESQESETSPNMRPLFRRRERHVREQKHG